jgi:hypothetical protein
VITRYEQEPEVSLALSHALPAIPIAVLEASVVILPRSDAFGRLARFRGPGWAAILPGMILAGTFGPITVPLVARTLALCVALLVPFVALIAAVSAVRRRLLAVLLVTGGISAALGHVAPGSQVALSCVTAVACISVGVALERLISRAWLLAGVVTMTALDIGFISSGIAVHQDVLLAAATRGLPGFSLNGVQLGSVYLGYPDLFLAGLVGAAAAADGRQTWAAGIVFVLSVALETLLVPGEILPGTLPLAATLLLMTTVRAVGFPVRRSRTRRPRSWVQLPVDKAWVPEPGAIQHADWHPGGAG